MNIKLKLKAFLALAAIAIALIPQAEAQNTNHAPGTVVSWGAQVIPYVAPGTRFTKIAGGGGHSLALKSDGTVVAWGQIYDNFLWVTATVPGGLNGVVAIAAGPSQSVYGNSWSDVGKTFAHEAAHRQPDHRIAG